MRRAESCSYQASSRDRFEPPMRGGQHPELLMVCWLDVYVFEAALAPVVSVGGWRGRSTVALLPLWAK